MPSMVTKRLDYKSFQLLVGPNIEKLTRTHPGSVLGFTSLATFKLQSIHFRPGLIDNALKLARPVTSLDAAHLCSKFKGNLYVASVLTGNNNVFPIGFMIAPGNKDQQTWWVQMLTNYLREACPIISQQGGARRGMTNDGTSLCETPFVFVSDCNKCLKEEAVKQVLPTNLEFSCAQHIQTNVTQRFGRNVAKTYSARVAHGQEKQTNETTGSKVHPRY